jgi:hypothetical protein
MQKWEYMVLRFRDTNNIDVIDGSQMRTSQLHEFLKELGEEGWEVVCPAGPGTMLLILKRPK